MLFAKTDPAAGARGITAFIVEPKKYPGFEARPIEMLGLSKALRTNVVYLDDFVVPVENRLGDEGQGFTIVMRCLQSGRVTVAAKALGVARACFEDAVAYARSRELRGQAIGRFQMVQSEIAEYRVSWLKSYADLFFTGGGSANVQKILIAEDALGYKPADRHHGSLKLRDLRRDDVADELGADELAGESAP